MKWICIEWLAFVSHFFRVPGMAQFLLVKVQPWITYRSCSEAQAEAGNGGVKEACSKVMSLRTET